MAPTGAYKPIGALLSVGKVVIPHKTQKRS
nr:MAG TPA: hypothetical protein [Caudoviricetes sp.]